MDTIFQAFAIGISVAGALVTFGITYGIVKTKQQYTETEMSELKDEVRGLRGEFELFRRACTKICKIPPYGDRSEREIREFPTEEAGE